jgi:hypothetical protein
MIERIHQFLKSLKERAKRELHIPNKPLRVLGPFYLYDIYALLLMIAFVALFFEGTALFSVESKTDVTLVVQYSAYFYGALMIFGLVFCFGYAYKVVSKIKEFDSITQYKYLMARRLVINAVIFLMIIFVCFFAVFLSVTSLKPDIADSLTLNRINGLFVSSIVGIFGVVFPWMFLPISQEQEIELDLTLIQDFETIADYNAFWTPAYVLKSLMKPIVHESERTLNHCLDIGKEFQSNFYHSFNTLCLVSILGNTEQNMKAKEYITGLGDILMEKRIEDSSKAKMILEHLEKVENDQSFSSFRKIQDTFGLQYSFEHFRKRFGKGWQITLGVLTVLALIIEIIRYFLSV